MEVWAGLAARIKTRVMVTVTLMVTVSLRLSGAAGAGEGMVQDQVGELVSFLLVGILMQVTRRMEDFRHHLPQARARDKQVSVYRYVLDSVVDYSCWMAYERRAWKRRDIFVLTYT